ncbi:uncharacterized protein LOC143036194 [Oratosquilla oratoria]|uniref:uncharacterized protein LOC143036194 n=1 Tax=Oratosquilla oratoria TaxID=337810 RepID=UPI003F76AD54
MRIVLIFNHVKLLSTLQVYLSLALLAVVVIDALPQGYNVPQPPPRPTYGASQYDFNWAVNDAASGNDFGHQESRDGDYTQGSYYVLLPDGRLQRVNYNVQGDSGFVAEVTYEGEARAYSPSQPSYTPPPPSYGGKLSDLEKDDPSFTGVINFAMTSQTLAGGTRVYKAAAVDEEPSVT